MVEISYSGEKTPKKRKFSKRLLLFLSFFIVVLVLLGGLGFFVTRGGTGDKTQKKIDLIDTKNSEVTSAPTESIEETPTPSEAKETIKKETIKVAVQNGSGEAGVAGKATEVLKTAGYSVVSTGNADNFDYSDVTIQVKNSKKQILNMLETDLSSDYTVSDTSTDLSEGQSYDALVIIGK